jgi:hypothetical protein
MLALPPLRAVVLADGAEEEAEAEIEVRRRRRTREQRGYLHQRQLISFPLSFFS